ncbi:MAG: type II toxin-antitoxin system RelE/ParE family toxin [Thermomicrobiales bacterium]
MSASDRIIVVSAKANADIRSIIRYAGRLCGLDVTKMHVQDLLDRLKILTIQPELGSPRPEYGRGRRGFVLDSYLVLYSVTRTEIRVARIIHTKLDVDRVLRG